ncbi:MAG: hypothetical protein ACOX5M_02140 [Bacillota bacterium]|jgi:hypothetical protein
MPVKSIYIRDEDLEWFDEAVAMEGESLSAVIGKIVKEYVQAKKSLLEGLSEIKVCKGTVVEGEPHNLQRFHFYGTEIASAHRWDSSEDHIEWMWNVYLTRKGKYVLYSYFAPPCQEVHNFVVCGSLEDLGKACREQKLVPEQLLDEVHEKLGLKNSVFLDI